MRYTSPPNQENDPAYASRGGSRNSTSGRSKYSLWDVTADKQSITYDSGDKLLRFSSTIVDDDDDDKSSSNFSDDGDDETQRYPHPLGFQNVVGVAYNHQDDNNTNRLGLTRFTLFEEDSDQEEEEEEGDYHQPLFLQDSHHQSQYLQCQQQKLTLLPEEVQIRTSVLPYTGLSLHTVGSANPTALLLQHLLSHRNKTLLPKEGKTCNTKSNNHSVSLYCEMERIADQLRSAANFSSSDEHPQIVHLNDLLLQKQLPAPLVDLGETARRVQQKIDHMIEKEREKVKRDYKVSFWTLYSSSSSL
jgi:hypothetical protein